MGFLSVISGILMAVAPPLAYTDQYISICRKHTSAGFSTDICGLLIIANITRVVYWLGDHFQVYLLIQSILMIAAQFGLLLVCITYRPASFYEHKQRRPGDFWQWDSFGAYLEFSALLILVHCVFFLIFYRFDVYVQILGFIALGLEATLPVPQLISNFQHRSTAGFRLSVLGAWFLGDAYKAAYYFLSEDVPLAFKACAIFQLSVDCLLCIQTFLFRRKTAADLAEREGLKEHQGVAGAESLIRSATGEDEDSSDEYEPGRKSAPAPARGDERV
ncbi:hypothetical protein JCM10207_004878 [Rhodosporidiobolus poonsookiae]